MQNTYRLRAEEVKCTEKTGEPQHMQVTRKWPDVKRVVTEGRCSILSFMSRTSSCYAERCAVGLWASHRGLVFRSIARSSPLANPLLPSQNFFYQPIEFSNFCVSTSARRLQLLMKQIIQSLSFLAKSSSLCDQPPTSFVKKLEKLKFMVQ